MKAAMMPETAHQTKAAHPAPAGAESAVGISTLSRPMPKPSMVRRICTTSDMKTPARIACQVQPENAVDVRVAVRGAMGCLLNTTHSIRISVIGSHVGDRALEGDNGMARKDGKPRR